MPAWTCLSTLIVPTKLYKTLATTHTAGSSKRVQVNFQMEVVVKLFSPVSIIVSALLVLPGGIGNAANAQTIGIAISSMFAQDATHDSGGATISGNWQISFTDRNGSPKQGTLQIEQDGSQLGGSFQGERGSAPLTGSLQGNQVALTVKARGREVSFTGTVDGSKMSGTTGQGTSWTAIRQ